MGTENNNQIPTPMECDMEEHEEVHLPKLSLTEENILRSESIDFPPPRMFFWHELMHKEMVRRMESQESDEENDYTRNNDIVPGHGRVQSPEYAKLTARLGTFSQWPSYIQQMPASLAEAGFYCTGFGDTVRCFACDGGLKNWDPEDDPWIEHARWFPQYPHVRHIKGEEFINLVRMASQESDEEDDYSRNNDIFPVHGRVRSPEHAKLTAHLRIFSRWPSDIQQMPASLAEAGFYCTDSSRPQTLPQQQNRSNELLSIMGHVMCPDYAGFSQRLESFSSFPAHDRVNHVNLANAGLYYTGVSDAVKCFVCDGQLDNWIPGDDPWTEHAKRFPECPYVHHKKGADFVKLVRTLYGEVDEDDQCGMHKGTKDAENINPRNESVSISEPCVREHNDVQLVIEMGFSNNDLSRAINELSSKGKQVFTAQEIVDVLLEEQTIN